MQATPTCSDCEAIIEVSTDQYGVYTFCDCNKKVYLPGDLPESWG